jgi:uncharacterized tellurite resistance protein B-like protein
MADDPKISASDVENMAKARGLTKDMLETWRESANAAERMNDSVEDLTDSLQRVLKFSDAQAKIVNQSVNKFQELATRAGDLNGTIQNLVDPTKMMYELFARSVDRFIELDNAALKFRETTGFLSSQTKQVEENIRIASRDLSQFGVTAELASEAAQQLATAFNDTAIANKENIEYVSLMKQNLGVAAEDSVSLLQNFMGIGAMTPDIARQTAGAAASLAKAAGVPLAKVMKDVATAGGEVFKLVRGSVNALIKGAVEARRLGIELKDIGAAADKFLDFQTSINSEMEASVLFGKDINFTRARELSYAGDLAGLAKEQSRILKEVGDFRKLDAFQAKALAESMGLSVDQLVKMNAKQEELNKLRIDDPALYAKYTANLDTIDKTNESLSEKYQKELKSQQLASQQQKLLASINSIMIELGEVVLPFLSGLISVVGVLLKISTITTKFILMPFKVLYDLVNDLWIKFEPGVDILQKMGYGLQFVIDKMEEFKVGIAIVSGIMTLLLMKFANLGFGNILMRAILFPLAPLKFVLQKTIGSAFKGAMDVAGETVAASGKKIASNLASSAVGAAPTTPSAGPSGFLNSMKGINPATVLSLGAALIMFAGAMYILAKAGQQFNTVDWSSLGKMGVILAVLGATIAGLMYTGVLETAAGGIALLGLAFIPFSISALAAGKGMQLFGQGIQSVSTGISDIASNISQIASLEDAFSVFTDTSILFGIAGMTLALSLLNEQLSKVATNLPALKNIESIKTATGGGNAEVVNKLDELIVLMKNGGIAVNIDGSKVSTAVGVATKFRGAY